MLIKKILGCLVGALLFVDVALAKDGDLKIEGTLQELTSTSAVVSGETLVVTLTTQFEDRNGNHISSSQFTIGSSVEAKYQIVGGEKILRELELKSKAVSPTPGPGTPSPTPGDDDRKKTNVNFGDDDSNANVKIELRRTGESKFKVQLNIPLAQLTPAPARSTLVANPVTATLSRNGSAYSTCTLKFDGITAAGQKRKAEYKLEIKTNKQGTRIVKGSKGSCDTDLSLDGTQKGLPSVQIGDSVVVQSQNPSLSITGLIN